MTFSMQINYSHMKELKAGIKEDVLNDNNQ